MPGALCCREHHVLLLDSNIAVSNNGGYKYNRVSELSFNEIYDDNIFNLNLQYIVLVEELLNGAYKINKLIEEELEEAGIHKLKDLYLFLEIE